MQPFLDTLPGDAAHAEVLQQFDEGCQTFEEDADAFLNAVVVAATHWENGSWHNALQAPITQRSTAKQKNPPSPPLKKGGIHRICHATATPLNAEIRPSGSLFGKGGQGDLLCDQYTKRLAPLAEASRDLVKQADLLYKLACRLIDVCEGELAARESELWAGRGAGQSESVQVAVAEISNSCSEWNKDALPTSYLPTTT